MLVFDNVSVEEEWKEILKNISFNINKWEWVFFVWKDSDWKSAILDLIIWEISPTSWKVFFSSKIIDYKNSYELQKYKQNFWIIVKDLKLIPSKTIYENIEFILYPKEKNENKIPEKINKILKRLNLEEKTDYYPEELSAWEKQKAYLARALAWDIKILILDEITSHLDESSRMMIFSFLKELKKEKDLAIIWTSSTKDITKWLADKTFEVENWILKNI